MGRGRGRRVARKLKLQITGGQATVLGYPLRRIGRRKLARLTFGVGMLAQNAASTLPASLTVADIVAEPVLERDRRYDAPRTFAFCAANSSSVRIPWSFSAASSFSCVTRSDSAGGAGGAGGGAYCGCCS